MHSTLLPPSHAARQRRLSQYSYGQMSEAADKSKLPSPSAPTLTTSPDPEPEPTQVSHLDSAPVPQLSGGDHGSLRLQPPPTIPEVPTKGPTHQPTLQFPTRPRINSLVNPATSSASPLAMLFQPLIVDEDVIMEDQEDNQNLHKAPNLLSYGPASRRRLVSIGPRRRGRTPTETSPVTSTLHRWHHSDTRQPSHSLTRSDDGDRLSRSPDHIQPNPSSLSVAETAGQVLEEEEREGGEPGLSRRLAIMEERQKRIEEMLVRLTESLS